MNTKEEVYKKFANSIYRYVYFISNNRNIAEDITSETFTRFFESVDMASIKNVKNYLIGISRNIFFSELTKSKDKIDFQNIEQEVGSKEEDNSLLVDAIKDELSKLDSSTKEVIALKIWENMKFNEIAKMISQSESAVKLKYYRGIEKLKFALGERKFAKSMYSFFGGAGLIGLITNLGSQSYQITSSTFSSIAGNFDFNSLFFTQTSMTATGLGVFKALESFVATTAGKLTVVGVASVTIVAGGVGVANVLDRPVPSPNVVERVSQDSPEFTQTIELRAEQEDIIEFNSKFCTDSKESFFVKIPSGWNCVLGKYKGTDSLVLNKDLVTIYFRAQVQEMGFGIDIFSMDDNVSLVEEDNRSFTLFTKSGRELVGGGFARDAASNVDVAINLEHSGSLISADLKSEIVTMIKDLFFRKPLISDPQKIEAFKKALTDKAEFVIRPLLTPTFRYYIYFTDCCTPQGFNTDYPEVIRIVNEMGEIRWDQDSAELREVLKQIGTDLAGYTIGYSLDSYAGNNLVAFKASTEGVYSIVFGSFKSLNSKPTSEFNTGCLVYSNSNNVGVYANCGDNLVRVYDRKIVIAGKAKNIFENNLNFRITDTSGSERSNGFIVVDSPDLGVEGPFYREVTLSSNEVDGWELSVFQKSAKDGSEIDMVKVKLK